LRWWDAAGGISRTSRATMATCGWTWRRFVKGQAKCALSSGLAARLRAFQPDVLCGPLVEGAFVALLVAQELGCTFTYANRLAADASDRLFTVEYRLPASLHPLVEHRRVAIVNDVINAGSAVRGAYHDLVSQGAEVVAIGTLLLLGDGFSQFAIRHGITVEALARMPNHLWTPDACPLCAKGVALETLAVA
jgi:orotate phosphoribosyltransferase